MEANHPEPTRDAMSSTVEMIQMIESFSITSQPLDTLPRLMKKTQQSTISSTKASLAVEKILVNVQWDSPEDVRFGGYSTLGYRAYPVWTKEMISVAKTLNQRDPARIWHRSRLCTLASPLLQGEEIRRRLDLDPFHHPDAMQAKVDDGLSIALIRMVLETVLEFLFYDSGYFKSYAKAHDTSSVLPGLKWSDMIPVFENQPSLAHAMLAEIRTTVSRLLDEVEINAGRYNSITWNFGQRARSPKLDHWADNTTWSGEVDRSRIVMFAPSFSTWTAFIPRHREFYSKIIDRTCQLLDIDRASISCPLADGASTYVQASQWMNDSRYFSAFDGKNWETYVPTILGPASYPLMAYLGNGPMLPSGITLTSILNTIAILRCFATLVSPGNTQAIVLGDDLNLFSRRALPTRIGLDTMIEFQDMDTRLGFVLGLSFKPNPDLPSIIGFKAMTDKADDTWRVQMPDVYDAVTFSEYRSASRGERRRYANMFLGYVGDTPIIDVMRAAVDRELPLGAYSPSEILDSLVSEESRVQTQEDSLNSY